jgi:selenophosphate synthase
LKKLDLLADKAKDWGFNEAKGYRDKFNEIMTQYNEIGRQIKESEGISAFTDLDL